MSRSVSLRSMRLCCEMRAGDERWRLKKQPSEQKSISADYNDSRPSVFNITFHSIRVITGVYRACGRSGAGAGAENGTERARKSGEREQGLKKIRWSGSGKLREREQSGKRVYRKRCERKFRPLPFRSRALSQFIQTSCLRQIVFSFLLSSKIRGLYSITFIGLAAK